MSEKRVMDDAAVVDSLRVLRRPAYQRLSRYHTELREDLEVIARERGLVVGMSAELAVISDQGAMKKDDVLCPVCGEGMSVNWREGKPYDYCPEHGEVEAELKEPEVSAASDCLQRSTANTTRDA